MSEVSEQSVEQIEKEVEALTKAVALKKRRAKALADLKALKAEEKKYRKPDPMVRFLKSAVNGGKALKKEYEKL